MVQYNFHLEFHNSNCCIQPHDLRQRSMPSQSHYRYRHVSQCFLHHPIGYQEAGPQDYAKKIHYKMWEFLIHQER